MRVREQEREGGRDSVGPRDRADLFTMQMMSSKGAVLSRSSNTAPSLHCDMLYTQLFIESEGGL